MRSKIVFVVLSLMLIGFGAVLVVPAPAARVAAEAVPIAGVAHKDPSKTAQPAPSQPLTVRVVGPGWDLLAPGVIANDGAGPAGKQSVLRERGLEVHLRAVTSDDAIEAALAVGGEDDTGAHLAVMPLSSLVTAQERLRPLDLRVVQVVAWSDGRHSLYAREPDALRELSSRDAIRIAGDRDDAGAVLALTLLELAGADPSRIDWAHGSAAARTAEWVVVEGGEGAPASGLHRIASTADAPRLVAWVVVAPRAVAEEPDGRVARFVEGWGIGVQRMADDPSGAARSVASLSGAPETVDVVRALGELRFVPLTENARLLGLAGRDPVTVDSLVAHHHGVLRRAGVLQRSAPEVRLVHDGSVAAALRAAPASYQSASTPTASGRGELLLRHEIARRELRSVDAVQSLGFVAAVFERSEIGVATRRSEPDRSELVEGVTARYELSADRFVDADRPRRAGIAIDVWRAP